MRKGKYTGLIAVRSGSKRIKNKNIKDFSDSSLLEIKISQAIESRQIDEVVVSSDCDRMLDIAKSMGVNALKRDLEYCTDSVPMNSVYEHLAKSVSSDHIVYLHVTSPLLKVETLDSCILKYKEMSSDYDSLATVESIKRYIWFNGKAINYDPNNHPRSQDLDEYYCLNFAVNIISRSKMIQRKNILGDNFYPYFLDEIESVDVDTQFEFDIAEFLYDRL